MPDTEAQFTTEGLLLAILARAIQMDEQSRGFGVREDHEYFGRARTAAIRASDWLRKERGHDAAP